MIENKEIKKLLLKKTSSSVKGTDLDSLDLSTYKGKRIENYDQKGNLLSVEDTRDLRYEKLLKLQEIREESLDSILLEVPLIDQLNIAMGNTTDAEATAAKDKIANKRTLVKAKKAEAIAAKTLDELDKINTQGI